MRAWQINPNIPPLAAMRAVIELVKSNDQNAAADVVQVKSQIGKMLTQVTYFMQLSMLLDVGVQSNLATLRMAEVSSSELLETGNHIMSMCDQVRTLIFTSNPSQWILKNSKTIVRGIAAIEDVIDMGLDYHNL